MKLKVFEIGINSLVFEHSAVFAGNLAEFAGGNFDSFLELVGKIGLAAETDLKGDF